MSLAVPLLLGVPLAVGVMLCAGVLPRSRRPGLPVRLDPYLRGLQPWRSRLLAPPDQQLTPFPALERLARPLLAEAAGLVDRWVGGSASVARRLAQTGRQQTLAQFRAEQVLWALLGLLGALLLAGGLPAALGRTPTAAAVLGAVTAAGVGGLLGRDWWLTRQVQRRQRRIVAEFPMVADLVCLAVTAGETPQAAIERTVVRTRGELSRELALVLADLRTGSPLAAALGQLAARVPIPQVARFVDGVVVAVDRGTPLAEVLRAQAGDVRDQQQRELIEVGGKKEVYMLIPVVFLILPVVVLFVLYPGFFSLLQIAR